MPGDRSSSLPPELAAALPPLAAALDQLGIGWHLVGALALQAHGIDVAAPTATLELAVGLRAAQVERLLSSLMAAFDCEQPWPVPPPSPLPPLRLGHRVTGATCELHVAPDTDYDRRALQRSARLSLLPFAAPVRVAAIEDLVLWLLRQESVDQTPDAVVELLHRCRGSWNHCYLLEWSERLGIAGPVDDLLLALREK